MTPPLIPSTPQEVVELTADLVRGLRESVFAMAGPGPGRSASETLTPAAVGRLFQQLQAAADYLEKWPLFYADLQRTLDATREELHEERDNSEGVVDG